MRLRPRPSALIAARRGKASALRRKAAHISTHSSQPGIRRGMGRVGVSAARVGNSWADIPQNPGPALPARRSSFWPPSLPRAPASAGETRDHLLRGSNGHDRTRNDKVL
eukprot:scaffold10504_cov124-Isochrysis_galbana.AAC.2